jgi:hypothetical protein
MQNIRGSELPEVSHGLRDSLDLLVGIFPDWRLYELRDLKNTVMEVSGSVPIITCNFNSEHHVRQLTEIFICLDKNMKPFHCPTPKFTLCTGAAIMFPAFNPSYINTNPTHKSQPRIPGGKPRNFYKPASNHPVAFKPAKPLAAMCMDPTHSTFLHDEQGHLIQRMDCHFDNASLNLEPIRILVP